MLPSLKSCAKVNLKSILCVKSLDIIAHRKIYNTNSKYSCLCGQIYFIKHKNEYRLNNIRIHSTQSDQHRQKVIIETVTPKIVIDKLSDLEQVLPGDSLKDATLNRLEIWKAKIDPYVKLARWDKPIGIYLLYWPCAWSIALGSLPGNIPASGTLQTAALFLVGAGLMRGAGCTINDLWDRDIDRQVARTRDRPLASGAISTQQAVAFLGAQLSLALLVLLQLNCYSVALGASSMLLVVAYPLAKRVTRYPQLVLGATFNWGALLGYSALQADTPGVCAPLYLAALAWTVVYDTIYAYQDKLDDARIGMKSTALTFSARPRAALGAALALSVSGLAAAGHSAGLTAPYYAALAVYALHVGRQIYTLNTDNPEDCAKKFKSNSLVGLIILSGILAGGYEQYKENRLKHSGKEDPQLYKSCVFG